MKRIMSFVLAMIMVLCMIVPVYAEETAEPAVTVTPSATSVNIGDTVTFTVSLSDFPKEKGFAVIPSFDTDVFEYVFVSAEPDNPDAPVNQMGSFLVNGALADCAPPEAVIAFNYATTINKAVFTFTLKAKKATTETEVFCTINTQSLAEDYTGHCDISVVCPHDYKYGAEMYNDTHHRYVCSICGEPKMEEHKWDDGEVITPASHTQKGETRYECTVCGRDKIVEVPKTTEHEYPEEWEQYSETQHIKMCGCGLHLLEDHNWNKGVVMSPATHTTTGSMLYTCTKCYYEKYEEIPKTTEHEYPEEWSQHSLTQHVKECACGEKIYEAHNWNAGEVVTPATHTSTGTMKYTCTECGYEKFEEIPKTTAHEYPAVWSKYSETQHVKECACGEKIYESHKWDGGVVTVKPTHTTYGEKTFTCIECGEHKYEKVEKTTAHEYPSAWSQYSATQHVKECACGEKIYEDHKWNAGVVTTDPTCKDTGVKTYTCTECGATKTESVPVTNDHKYGEWTTTGTTEHKHVCSVCKKTETAPHTWDSGKVTRPASHVQEGEMTYECTACHATKTESIPKTTTHGYPEKWSQYSVTQHVKECACGEKIYEDHKWNAGVVTTEPTCKDMGVKTYTCSECGATKTETVPVTNDHKYGEWTTTGTTEHKHVCSVCKKTETAPHTWDSGKVTRPASHVQEGEMTYECTACHATKTESIPKTTTHGYPEKWSQYSVTQHVKECACGEKIYEDHKWNAGVVTTEPTCKDTGVKTYTCTECGATKTESVPVTNDHKYGEWTTTGAAEHKHVCFVCKKAETAPHTWDSGVVTTEPTCKDTGVKTYTCSDCKATKTESIPVTNDHKYGEWTTTGTAEHKHVCSVCKKAETAPHTWDEGKVTTAPTCKDTGVKTYTCTVCKGTKTETIPVTTTHTWGKGTKVDDNNHSHTCTVCQKSETVAHTWDAGKVTKAATCKETGVKTYTCTDCGATKTETIAKSANHYYSSWKVEGDKHVRTCIDCGAKETAAHKWNSGAVTKQPTHTEEGVTTYTCSVCSATKTESIAKTTEHSWSECVPASDGKTHTFKCACGATETKDHSFDAGVVTKQATHTETGVKTYTCADCKHSYEEVLEKTAEHVFGEWKHEATVGKHYRECPCGQSETGDCAWDDGKITTAPTYEAEGVKTYTCTVCGGTKTETAPKLEKTDEIVSGGNEDVKITVSEGSEAVLNANTVLEAEKFDYDAPKAVKTNIEKAVGGNAEVLASYDISLVLDGAKVQPGGKVAVTLPIPEDMGDYKSVQVVYIDDDGYVTPCDTTVNGDGTLTFVTDHFSHYAIVGVTDASPVTLIIIAAVGTLVLAGAVAAIVIIKKKKKA